MNALYIILFLVLIFIYQSQINEHFFGGRNKCFDCEKDITDITSYFRAFPSKCYQCEKQLIDIINEETNFKFEMFGRNKTIYR